MNKGQSACESKNTAETSLLKQHDLLLETLWDNLRDEIRDAKSSIASDRYDTNIQESKTMAFIGTGALWIVHSIVSHFSGKLIMNMIIRKLYLKCYLLLCIDILLEFSQGQG